ncbi:MAG: glutamate--tRNA ligase [Gammaproteobacteria bacterium]|nr:glutamate--tRNA ligase [Gammaproteobacteria bacterium]
MIRTRFAPSPTGWLHIGGVRTALFSWLYAKNNNGEFLIRIDDTDTSRSTHEFSQSIISSLTRLGLSSDKKITYQSERFDKYINKIEELLEKNYAYYDEIEITEKTKDTNLDLQYKNRLNKPNHVIRFKNPKHKKIIVNDEIHGDINFDPKTFHDVVILRSNGIPTYNLTSVVDDIEFQISHIIRGDDHLNNTAIQINLFNAFGANIPKFAHLPMIHGKDGKRLSKRHGAIDIKYFFDEGYLNEAIINYLARTGWSHGDKEIFSTDELIELFTLKRVTKSAAIFDHDKLNWLNQYYIKNMKIHDIRQMILPYMNQLNIKVQDKEYLDKILELGIEREFSLKKIAESLTYYFEENLSYDIEIINKFDKNLMISILDKSIDKFGKTDFSKKDNLSKITKNICEELNLKFSEVGPIIRFALTGKLKAPSIDDLSFILGFDKTLKRLNDLRLFSKA